MEKEETEFLTSSEVIELTQLLIARLAATNLHLRPLTGVDGV